ncbi:MAG: hypothetical protein ABFD79_18080 [Phycisphaerales bacterium]
MTNLKQLVSTVIILSSLISYSNCISAPREPQQPREPSARQQAMAERRQQFETEAVAAIPEIEAEYNKYVSYVNTGRVPDDANVREGLRFLTKNKKFVTLLNKQHKGGTYYALSAWVSYFDGKPDKVQKQIAEGIKQGTTDKKFIDTAYALSILNQDFNSIGQLSSLTEKIAAEDTNFTAVEPAYTPDQSGDVLNINVNNIKPNVIGKDFSPLTMGNDKVIISVLLWEIDANELERFAPPKPVEPNDSNKPVDANNPPPPVEEPPVEQQTFQPVEMPDVVAFTNLSKRYNKNPKTVFVGINFNDPSKIKYVENWMAKNPQSWQSAPPLEQVQQLVISLIGERPTKPMLLIAGPDKKIRYAGDVNSILPNMIIQKILTNPQEFAEPNDVNAPAKTPDVNSQPQIELMEPAPAPSDTNTVPPQTQNQPQPQVTEPNTQNNQTPAATAPQTENKNASDDFFDPRAETLLENAKAFFKIGNRQMYHAYAKPIEMCRTVIKDFPNTKYEQEARVLMRQVPERFRERYHITDAELGL